MERNSLDTSKNLQNKHKIWWGVFYWTLTLLPIAFVIYAYISPLPFFTTKEEIQSVVSSSGMWGPIVFVLIQILQVVVTPINHYIIGIAGGYLFGTWLGFILNWVGRAIGTIIAFIIARLLGRRIVEHLVSKETISKFDGLFSKPEFAFILFIMYFLPGFPDDELVYLAGASKIPTTRFLVVSLLGHVGGSLGLAYIGAGIDTKDPLFYIIMIACIILAILFFVYWKKIKNSDEGSTT